MGSCIDGNTQYATYTLLIDGLPGTGTGHFGGFDTEAESNAAFAAHVPYLVHLDQETVIGFAAPDHDLDDNLGGSPWTSNPLVRPRPCPNPPTPC